MLFLSKKISYKLRKAGAAQQTTFQVPPLCLLRGRPCCGMTKKLSLQINWEVETVSLDEHTEASLESSLSLSHILQRPPSPPTNKVQ